MITFNIAVEIALAAALGVVVYVYLLYPLLIYVLAGLFGKELQIGTISDQRLPEISLLIAAHNEQAVMEARIRNALAMDYPAEKFEVVIASDGSTDATAEIVRRHASDKVRLLDYGVRRGKAATLNNAMTQLSGSIVILSDANTSIARNAARSLVRWFEDPGVGCVCGQLVLVDPQSGKNVDGIYWKFETFLKRQEAKLGALLGANGAIYALRRNLFQPIPDDTIVDDLVIPLLTRLRSQCSIAYDPTAVAFEETALNTSAEFHRRARIGAGGWQAIAILWRLLNPRHGWIAFTFFSHKVLRWFCPFCLILALVANALLLRFPTFRWLLVSQILSYVIALAGCCFSAKSKPAKMLRLAHMFVLMNAALLVGFFRWAFSAQTGIWQRTSRTPQLQTALAVAANDNS